MTGQEYKNNIKASKNPLNSEKDFVLEDDFNVNDFKLTESEAQHKTDQLQEQLKQQAYADSADLVVPSGNELQLGAAAATTVGSLTYYLGNYSEYFNDAAGMDEIPIYAAYLATSFISARMLTSICGKQNSIAQLKGVGGGGVSGAGVGGVIAGIAFTTFVDILLVGAGTLGGGIIGYFYTRRGRKKHSPPCGALLPCDTWICPKCYHIINTDSKFASKTYLNILELCQLLNAELGYNVFESLAYLQHSDLLTKGQFRDGMQTLWERKKLDLHIQNPHTIDYFMSDWNEFINNHNLSDADDNTRFRQWNRYLFERGFAMSALEQFDKATKFTP